MVTYMGNIGERLSGPYFDALEKASGLSFPVKKADTEEVLYADLLEMTHLLIAGTTGTGKTKLLDTILLALVQKNDADKLRLILYDSKAVDLGIYNSVKNMLIPVVTDAAKMNGALQWLLNESSARLKAFLETGTRTLNRYNDVVWKHFLDEQEFPRIVVIIDDLTTLLIEQPNAADLINQLLMKGRTVGIHIIVATQTPSWKETRKTALLFRSKIVFAMPSAKESKLLLGQSGAERLAAYGEAFFSENGTPPVKINPFLLDEGQITAATREHKAPLELLPYSEEALTGVSQLTSGKDVDSISGDMDSNYDELLHDAIEVVVETGMASVSMLQRRMKLAYSRAARLVDQMEGEGIVGPFEGSKPRQVLISKAQWQEIKRTLMDNDEII